ncbi:unnamed protein product [Kluyveromyces dobzhanskii CBS 2104]|uniref:Pre-rRNA-processing protein IPI3 n=1 Tax=Kluyveromyces dobzhanskii CBS 2104 TaxID=1427455 RepID=A0A0A8L5Y9_9SACH|nr:unnamed protein product [Kluyveromyces dobzhanskii CBS 2104]
MEEQVIFTSGTTGTVSTIHSLDQSNLRQCQNDTKFSCCVVKKKYLFVAQSKKALIQVYDLHGSNKRESVEQRLPVPEVLQALETVDEDGLLLGATDSGKLYIWQIASGNLLNVKPMAHYQGIVKIKSICHGKYVVTAGNDSRLIFWQTMDLVQREDPKPLFTIHDHSLPITDFVFSNSLGDSLDGEIYTTSKDMSLRCYSISAYHEPICVSTFTFPTSLNCVSLDTADRAVYVGTDSGVIQIPAYYKLGTYKIVSLLQPIEPKIYSVTEVAPGAMESDLSTREKSFSIGQIICTRIVNGNTTAVATSIDGSLLVTGDSSGKCTVTEIFSNQPLKEIRALSTNDSTGPVSNLIVFPITQQSESLLDATKVTKPWKFPTLQRSIVKREQGINDVYVQFQDNSLQTVLPISDFGTYLDTVASEENVFHQTGSINSTVNRIASSKASATAGGKESKNSSGKDNEDDLLKSKDKEIARLNGLVLSLTDAYQDIRMMHEELMKEHQALLNSTKKQTEL